MSQYSDSTFNTKSTDRLRKDTMPTRKVSLSSFEEPASSIYTTMSGSSSSGSRDASVKSQVDNPEFMKNIVVKLPAHDESNERYTSSPSPHAKRHHVDSNRRKQQQLRADGYIESGFLGFNKAKTKERSTKRQKRETRKSQNDGDDDFDYVDYSTEGSRSNSRNQSRRSSERSRHLYAEIREFKPANASGNALHAQSNPKLFASREVVSAL